MMPHGDKTMNFQKIKLIANRVRDEQAVWRAEWSEILYYCTTAQSLYNQANDTTGRTTSQKQFKFDNTAQDACEDSANYLYQMCLGNIESGFKIELDQNEKEINDIFKKYLLSEESCFQDTARNYFHEARLLANVGVGNFIKDNKLPYVDLFTMDTTAFQRANQTKVWLMVDDRSYPVYELIEIFGEDAIPEKIKEKYKKDALYRHNLKTVICPNENYEENKLGINGQKYKMIRFFEESEEPITTDYLEYMPEFVDINRTNREIYSRAPASKVLNIIKALNRLVEMSMYGFSQLNNPTTLVMINNAFKDLKIRKVPGAMIPMKLPQSGSVGQLTQPLQNISDTGGTFAILRDYFTNLILHAWRVDEFFQAVQTQMTATQASILDQRTKSFLISEIEPHKIVWTNVIKRIFRDCWKCGMFSQYELDNETVKNIKVKWNNFMSLREKQDILTNIGEFMQYSEALIARDPQLQSAIDNFNLLLDVANATGQASKIASEDDYTKVQEQSANASAMAQQLEMNKIQSETQKNLATANAQQQKALA